MRETNKGLEDTIFFLSPKEENPTILEFDEGDVRYVLVKDLEKIRRHIDIFEGESEFSFGRDSFTDTYALGMITSPSFMDAFLRLAQIDISKAPLKKIRDITFQLTPQDPDLFLPAHPEALRDAPQYHYVFTWALQHRVASCFERTSIMTGMLRSRGEKVKIIMYDDPNMAHAFPEALDGKIWRPLDTQISMTEIFGRNEVLKDIFSFLRNIPEKETKMENFKECTELSLSDLGKYTVPASEF